MPSAGAPWDRSCCLRRDFWCWSRSARPPSLLVNKAREDNALGRPHGRGREPDLHPAAANPPRRKRRARLSADLASRDFWPSTRPPPPASFPTSTSSSQLTADNPVQAENAKQLRPPVETRLAEFARGDRVRQTQRYRPAASRCCARPAPATPCRRSARSPARCAREEDRLFATRTATADRTQQLASIVTVAGSGLVIALAGLSIFLVRRSSRARDEAEAQVARQQSQPRGHGRRTHRRPARGQ